MGKVWNKGLHVYTKGGGIKYTTDNCICLICSKPFHCKQSQIDIGKGKYCSKVCYSKVRSEWMKDKDFNPAYRVDFKLENNPNWCGGKSFEPYPLGWNHTFKEQIRYRDRYKCQICGKPEIENGRKLCVHHKDYDKSNLKPENLVSLCTSCHSKTTFRRKYWMTYFSGAVMQNAPTR